MRTSFFLHNRLSIVFCKNKTGWSQPGKTQYQQGLQQNIPEQTLS
jgi:hypothetical protein